MVASRESAALAEVLIRQTCAKQTIDRDQLTIHADRGSREALLVRSRTPTEALASNQLGPSP